MDVFLYFKRMICKKVYSYFFYYDFYLNDFIIMITNYICEIPKFELSKGILKSYIKIFFLFKKL